MAATTRSARRISYQALAAAFAANKPFDLVSSLEWWRQNVMAVADVLAQGNPKFNRKRFLTAAGVL